MENLERNLEFSQKLELQEVEEMMKKEMIWEKEEFEIEEFFDLVRRNPVLFQYWSAYETGKITRESALMYAIRFLIEQNESMFGHLVEYVSRYGKLKDENA